MGLLLINILLFTAYQYTQQINEKYRELQLMQQKEKADEEYYTALQEQYENQRILIHDIGTIWTRSKICWKKKSIRP